MDIENIKIQLELTAEETFMVQALLSLAKEGSFKEATKISFEIINKKIEKAQLQYASLQFSRQQIIERLNKTFFNS